MHWLWRFQIDPTRSPVWQTGNGGGTMEKKGTLKIEKAGREGKSGGNMFGVSAGRTAPATEKVSVNMNIATLAQIDLLVDQGHYSNRSDFINEAVRQSLEQKRCLLYTSSSRAAL